MNWKIPLFKVHMASWEEIECRLKPVLYSGFVAEGEEVAAFEKNLANFFQVSSDNVFCTNSCTSGLTIALRYLGVKHGTTVIAPPQTCIATVTPIETLGAKIIWADIDPLTGMIDPDSVRDIIQDDTKAVMPVHWAGDIADISSIHKACAEFDVGIVEDAAQAFGATYKTGSSIASSGSDFIVFSFQAIKHLTCGDGGVVICKNAEMEKIADNLSWFGIDRIAFRKPDGEINWDSDVPFVGFKMHMNNIAASIGNAQLATVKEKVVDLHQRNGRILDSGLRDIDEMIIPPRQGNSAYWVLSIHAKNRDQFVEFMQNKGVQASRLHARIDPYTGLSGFSERHLPGTVQFCKTQVCLPCGWWLSPDDLDYIVDSVKEFYVK